MNTCPVFRRTGGHSYESTVPGPIGSILAPFRDPDQHTSLPFACSLCGSCTDVCPVKIDLHHQLFAMRSRLDHQQKLGGTKKLTMQLASSVLRHTWFYRLAGRVARYSLRWLPRFLIYNPLNGWGRQRELPSAPEQSFRRMYEDRQRKERP